jgi:hypothetical protein
MVLDDKIDIMQQSTGFGAQGHATAKEDIRQRQISKASDPSAQTSSSMTGIIFIY